MIAPFEPLIVTSSGEKVSITCNVKKGSPPFKIEWSKDGEAVQSDEHKKVIGDQEDSMLTIKSTRANDAGNYTCSAKNAFGSGSFSTRLMVQGRSRDLLVAF